MYLCGEGRGGDKPSEEGCENCRDQHFVVVLCCSMVAVWIRFVSLVQLTCIGC
jgi:hypothetical protein